MPLWLGVKGGIAWVARVNLGQLKDKVVRSEGLASVTSQHRLFTLMARFTGSHSRNGHAWQPISRLSSTSSTERIVSETTPMNRSVAMRVGKSAVYMRNSTRRHFAVHSARVLWLRGGLEKGNNYFLPLLHCLLDGCRCARIVCLSFLHFFWLRLCSLSVPSLVALSVCLSAPVYSLVADALLVCLSSPHVGWYHLPHCLFFWLHVLSVLSHSIVDS